MQYVDGIAAHPIKDTEWIADDGDDTNLRTLGNPRSGFGCMANPVDDIRQPELNGLGRLGAGTGGAIGRDARNIGNRAPRIDQLHAERNFAKAASISISVANSPPSIEAIAASIACNSSREAR